MLLGAEAGGELGVVISSGSVAMVAGKLGVVATGGDVAVGRARRSEEPDAETVGRLGRLVD